MQFEDLFALNEMTFAPDIDIGGEQRTEDWFEQRRGRFTGSQIKDLMSCERGPAKMAWGRPEKMISFSDTALAYIYAKAKERQRGKVLTRSIGKNGEYGEEAEGIVFEHLKKKYTKATIEEVGFSEFLPGVAGASPDGRITQEGKVGGIEIKLATEWKTYMNRVEKPFEPSHQDFAQIQAEMLALNVDNLLYCVCEPPKSLYDMDITDIEIIPVKADKIYQNCIIERCKIGDAIIKEYLAGVKFYEAVSNVTKNYKISYE